MDKSEIKAQLLNAINSIIKDEPEEADVALHDVLAAKMKDRLGIAEPEVNLGDDDPSFGSDDLNDPEATD